MLRETGKVIAVLPKVEGVSKKTGEKWANQQFVIEIDEAYTRRVVFQINGLERIEKADLRIGEIVEVKAQVEGHCFQDRWYNDVRVYDIYRQGRSILQDN